MPLSTSQTSKRNKEKQYKRCFCNRCGGPDGPGRDIPPSTYYAHQKKIKQQYKDRQEAESAFLMSVLGASMGGNHGRSSVASGENEDEGDEATDEEMQEGEGQAMELDKLHADSDSEARETYGQPGAQEEGPNDAMQVDHDNDYSQSRSVSPSRDDTPDPGSLDDIEKESNNRNNRPPTPPPPQMFSNDEDDEEEPEYEEEINFTPAIEDIRIARQYIDELRTASLDSNLSKAQLPEEVRQRLQEPPTEELKIDDPTIRLSIDLFLALDSSSEATYNAVKLALQRRFPDEKILSHYRVKRLIEDITGISPIFDDMCINSCAGFTGPYKENQQCPTCKEPRYNTSGLPHRQSYTPRKQFYTIPIGPQLQALWRSKESSERIKYREKYTQQIVAEMAANEGRRKDTMPYRDFFDGSDYLEAWMDGKIKAGDMVLLLSLDGAQLYRNKASDCWMYIWVILDHSPDTRYKKRHILPGGFIPGPNKPKNLDSFMFPGLYHLSAVQHDGMKVWDASEDEVFESNPFFALGTADGPGMACMNGFVGHQGRVHCRLYCPICGRHKDGASQYYPARLKPFNYAVEGCCHPDVSLTDLLDKFDSKEKLRRYRQNLEWVERSPNPTEFKKRRLQTGICKPSIFLGLPSNRILSVPNCFPLDVMHLPALNLPDLFLSLWRGTIDCDKTDSRTSWDWAVLKGAVWKEHGKAVVDTTPYLPGSFDRTPRNPAEKLTSGYKAWEFLIYFYGFGPSLFFRLLPDVYWKNFCKLVRGIRILLQEEIYPPQLEEADTMLTSFSTEFEQIYYQRRADRLHFVRPSIHTPSHLPFETERVGPGIIYSQWFMERTIGNLGEEIKQHSDPFSNLAQRGLRRCQVNALKAMVPDIEPIEAATPRGAWDAGGMYYLLPAVDTARRPISDLEQDAFSMYFESTPHLPNPDAPIKAVTRWARLRLPNRQVVRTLWKEEKKTVRKLRCSRNIKFKLSGGGVQFAEVLYFAIVTRKPEEIFEPLAVVSLYGEPDHELLNMSFQTYYSVKHRREAGIQVIPVNAILSVVAMVPDHQYKFYKQDEAGTHLDRWFLVEKPGLPLVDRYLDGTDMTQDDLAG